MTELISHDAPLPDAPENPRLLQEGEVPGDNGKIDAAAAGNLCHRAWPTALRKARQELDSRGITERPKELRIKEAVDRPATRSGLPRRAWNRLA